MRFFLVFILGLAVASFAKDEKTEKLSAGIRFYTPSGFELTLNGYVQLGSRRDSASIQIEMRPLANIESDQLSAWEKKEGPAIRVLRALLAQAGPIYLRSPFRLAQGSVQTLESLSLPFRLNVDLSSRIITVETNCGEVLVDSSSETLPIPR